MHEEVSFPSGLPLAVVGQRWYQKSNYFYGKVVKQLTLCASLGFLVLFFVVLGIEHRDVRQVLYH